MGKKPIPPGIKRPRGPEFLKALRRGSKHIKRRVRSNKRVEDSKEIKSDENQT